MAKLGMAKLVQPPIEKTNKKKCGIIMPIASCTEYSAEHWKDVLSILVDAINETDFEPRLVSDDVAIGLIHDRIVTNIYNDEIIVCDVSSKNPNVMFELGLRLAFDKPTIIIKDEKTGYSFDTGVIEHISYPSSLRFNQIVEFKNELAKKIIATYKRSQEEPNFSPFLKSFGKTIIPASIQQTEISEGKFILEQLDIVKQELKAMRADKSDYKLPRFTNSDVAKKHFYRYFFNNLSEKNVSLSESELFNLFIQEAKTAGVNFTFAEISTFLNDYRNKNSHDIDSKLNAG